MAKGDATATGSAINSFTNGASNVFGGSGSRPVGAMGGIGNIGTAKPLVGPGSFSPIAPSPGAMQGMGQAMPGMGQAIGGGAPMQQPMGQGQQMPQMGMAMAPGGMSNNQPINSPLGAGNQQQLIAQYLQQLLGARQQQFVPGQGIR